MFQMKKDNEKTSRSHATVLSSDEDDDGFSAADLDIADGELLVLVDSLDETTAAAIVEREGSISATDTPLSGEEWYGNPLSVQQAIDAMPLPTDADDEGQTWKALVIPDRYCDGAKPTDGGGGKGTGVALRRGLNPKDFDDISGRIKPRRATLPLTQTDLLSSLTCVPSSCTSKPGEASSPRYIFHGALNGWPGLQTLELIALEVKRDTLPGPHDLVRGRLKWNPVWQTQTAKTDDTTRKTQPKPPSTALDASRVYRATLRGAPWTNRGWSTNSLGYCFWFEAQNERPCVRYGTDLTRLGEDSVGSTDCARSVHMMSHRYARRHETPRDRLTYHSVCLLEWDHGRFTTVVESAYLNGMGGYKGKSNWYDDRDEEPTALYQSLPPEMIAPWRTNSAEIRCYDIPCCNHEEFQNFVHKYTGHNKRFVDPQFHFSHPVRLSFRSKPHIAQYLINYISRDTSYAELKRNCQTFCADLCSFLAGKKGIVPYHPVSRIEYSARTYLFLYDSFMYQSRQSKKTKAKQMAAEKTSR